MATDSESAFWLRKFDKAGYDKGGSLLKQILWLTVSGLILRRWWCPNRVRVAVIRMFGGVIGERTLIRHNVKIHWPWKLTVGSDCWIGEEVWILNLEPVTVGSNTCISQGVLLCTGSHDRKSASFAYDNGRIDIGEGVWVAVRATILRGVTLGDRCVVGAASLITSDVPAGTMRLADAPRVTEMRS
jgi:putative colanic acid biosynthesis acetyltransferase WcaF